MKKIFSICAMFSVILFGACTDVDTAGETPEVPGTPEEPVVAPEIPVVPAGFDWSTETGVNLTLESGVTTNVSVYSEEDCQDNSAAPRRCAPRIGRGPHVPPWRSLPVRRNSM